MVAVFHGHLVPEPDQIRIAISVITRMELRAWPGLSTTERLLLDEILAKVDVIAIDNQIESIAVQIRLDHRLKLPDAIIAATAICHTGALVTNDSGFRRVPNLVVDTF